MTEPTVEQKAEELARAAAERAAGLMRREADRATALALQDAERMTALAVARAVKDAAVDRTLLDHSRHLEAINGSQHAMAVSLEAVKEGMGELVASGERQAAVSEAVAGHVAEQARQRFSKRTLILMGVGAAGGYGGLFAALLALH